MGYGTVTAQSRHSSDPPENLFFHRPFGNPRVGVTKRGAGTLEHARKPRLATTAGFLNRCANLNALETKAFRGWCAVVVPDPGHTHDQKDDHEH